MSIFPHQLLGRSSRLGCLPELPKRSSLSTKVPLTSTFARIKNLPLGEELITGSMNSSKNLSKRNPSWPMVIIIHLRRRRPHQRMNLFNMHPWKIWLLMPQSHRCQIKESVKWAQVSASPWRKIVVRITFIMSNWTFDSTILSWEIWHFDMMYFARFAQYFCAQNKNLLIAKKLPNDKEKDNQIF